MQIRHLSHGELSRFGRIVSECPPEDGVCHKRRMTFTAGNPIPRYEATAQTVLDYVSGMSVLVLSRGGRTEWFYLDRVVALLPGTQFAVMPMRDSCCVDIYAEPEGLRPVDCLSADFLKSKPDGLAFERIYTFLYQECAQDFYFRGEKHMPYELVYVDRGELHNLVRGQDILLKQQSFMIIDSDDWHAQYADRAVSFLTVSFWAEDRGLHAITNRAFSLTPQRKGMVQKLLTQDKQDAYREDYAASLLKLLLIELLRDADSTAQPIVEEHSENRIVDLALQYISENLRTKLTLEDLAGLVHVSVPYLHKLFQTHLGISPGKYINKIRIEECKALLREGEMPMGRIAEVMGYSSLQQFSRQFRSLCGITPTQYVRSLR